MPSRPPLLSRRLSELVVAAHSQYTVSAAAGSTRSVRTAVARRPNPNGAAQAAAARRQRVFTDGQPLVLASGSAADVLPFQWGFTVGSVRSPVLDEMYRSLVGRKHEAELPGDVVRSVDGPNPWSTKALSRAERRAFRDQTCALQEALGLRRARRPAHSEQRSLGRVKQDEEADLLARLNTLDDELASVVRPARTASAEDVDDYERLLELFVDRYAALPGFVGSLRETTLARLFALGLPPTATLGTALVGAAFAQRAAADDRVRAEVKGLLGQLRRFGVGKASAAERARLLWAVREGCLGRPGQAFAPLVQEVDLELDQMASGTWNPPWAARRNRRASERDAGDEGDGDGETSGRARDA